MNIADNNVIFMHFNLFTAVSKPAWGIQDNFGIPALRLCELNTNINIVIPGIKCHDALVIEKMEH